MTRFTKVVFEIQNRLIKNNLPIAHINLIAEHVLNKDMNTLLIEDCEITDRDYHSMLEIIKVFEEEKTPIAQQVGFEYFYNYKFLISKKCLIPRIETEELVYNTVEFCKSNFKKNEKIKLYDCCCGSGAIGISIFLELRNSYEVELFLSDLSKDALEVCDENLKAHGISALVFCNSSITCSLKNINVFVANPPYIPITDEVDELVAGHEPHMALYGGKDGLDVYYDILGKINLILAPKYFIGFEHGEGHHVVLNQIKKEIFPNSECYVNYDMFDRERNTFIYNFGKLC